MTSLSIISKIIPGYPTITIFIMKRWTKDRAVIAKSLDPGDLFIVRTILFKDDLLDDKISVITS